MSHLRAQALKARSYSPRLWPLDYLTHIGAEGETRTPTRSHVNGFQDRGSASYAYFGRD